MFWSDDKTLFFFVCAALTLLVLALSLLPMTKWASYRWVRWSSPFLVALFLLMLAARWPGFFYPKAFEVDEAQIVAAAMALAEDPVFFRSVDGASTGPLVVYPLLLPLLFGQELTLFSSRLIGVCITFGGVVAIFLGLRGIFGQPTARLAATAGALFFAFSSFWNYVHYNSELLVAGLCVAGTACLFQVIARSDYALPRARKVACLGGFFLSLVPFAKLQSVPQALLIGTLVTVALVWRSKAGGFREVVSSLAMLAAATLIFPAAFLLMIWVSGAWDYFWVSYILNNFGYRASASMPTSLVIEHLILGGDDLWNWLPLLLTFCVIACIPAMLCCKRSRSGYFLIAAGLAIFALAVASVLIPGRPYFHYLLLLPFPVAMLAGVILGCILKNSETWMKALAVIGFVLLALAPGVSAEIRNPDSWAGRGMAWTQAPLDPVSQRLIELRQSPDDRLLVWGWMPYYHVYTGMVQSHRLSICTQLFDFNERLRFYRKAFLDDLNKIKPEWVVDAVAPGSFHYTERETHGIQTFPRFEEILYRDYKQVDEVDGVRIYQRIKE
ncbi:MAG: hypothetical protein ACOVMP_11240 [Chthoniobacterales bacterium]